MNTWLQIYIKSIRPFQDRMTECISIVTAILLDILLDLQKILFVIKSLLYCRIVINVAICNVYILCMKQLYRCLSNISLTFAVEH